MKHLKHIFLLTGMVLMGGCFEHGCGPGPRATYELAKPVTIVSVTEKRTCVALLIASDGETLQVEGLNYCALIGKEGTVFINNTENK